MLIGKVLDSSNPEITQALADGTMTQEVASVSYNYTAPLVMLAGLGAAALVLGFVLKAVDRKKNLGLELPNVAPESVKAEVLEAEAEAAED